MSNPQEGEGSDQLGVLFPDQTITVAGEEVRVRALRFREGLEVLPTLRPLLDGMQEMANEAQEDPESLTSGKVLGLLEDNPDAWLALMEASTDRDREWLEAIGIAEGEDLALAVWRANSPFLLRRLVLRQMKPRPEAQPDPEAGSDTPKSSTS